MKNEEKPKKWKEYIGKQVDMLTIRYDRRGTKSGLFHTVGKLIAIDSGFVYIEYKGRHMMIPMGEVKKVDVL